MADLLDKTFKKTIEDKAPVTENPVPGHTTLGIGNE